MYKRQVYPSNCNIIVLYDVGGELHWRGTRDAAPAVASRLLSYYQNPGVPPHNPTGRGTNTRSLWRPRPPMVANHRRPPTPRLRRFYGVRPHAVPWPGCLCPILPVSASLRDTMPASFGLLRVYTLQDSGDFHLPSLCITLCDTSPPAASVVAAPIRNEWSPISLGSSPAFASTWRSAARASGYLHTLTSLPHRYDDKGTLSGNVGYTMTVTLPSERRRRCLLLPQNASPRRRRVCAR